MIHIVSWLWSQPGYRKKFTARHVNTLCRMVRRNLSVPHEFVCVTDMPKGLDSAIRVLTPPPIPRIAWPGSRPNCFRRLWAFSSAARFLIGARIVSLDLDCVVTGSLDPLVARKEPFVIWRDPLHPSQYNGSLWAMQAGSRRQVWDEFKGERSKARMSGKRGSDQGWISAVLGPNEATYTAKDGVYSYKANVRKLGGCLPKDARMVIFHGKPDPWEVKEPWVKEHYR